MALVLGDGKKKKPLQYLYIQERFFLIARFQLKSNWTWNGQMLFFIFLLCAAYDERTTPFLKLPIPSFWGLSHFWLFFSHITPFTIQQSLLGGGFMMSKSLDLALTFILTRYLHFQLAFIISQRVLPTPQTPKVYIYLHFRLCSSTWISYLISIIINFPVTLSISTGTFLDSPYPNFIKHYF